LTFNKDERAGTPLEDVIEEMRRDTLTEVKRADCARLITRFEDSNLTTQRNEARVNHATTSDQIYRMETRIAALEKRPGMPAGSHEPQNQLDPHIAGINLDVLDPPSLPVAAVYPDHFLFMSIGFGAGLAAALIVVVFRRKLPPIPFPEQTA
jgi:hypothetical protein